MSSKEHDDFCVRAAKYLKRNGFGVSFDDRFRPSTCNGEQPDAIGFRSLVSCLIEVKISRSDFLADKNKRFRKDPSLGIGDWRFYMCPPEIIMPEDLPEGWGLLWAYEKKIKKVHGWPPNTHWYNRKPFNSDKDAELSLMYSALRRMEIKGHLDSVYEKLI